MRLRSETSHGSATWPGPVKDYGVDANVFYGRFNGDREQLLNYFLGQHRTFIGRHADLAEDLTKLEGKQIG